MAANIIKTGGRKHVLISLNVIDKEPFKRISFYQVQILGMLTKANAAAATNLCCLFFSPFESYYQYQIG